MDLDLLEYSLTPKQPAAAALLAAQSGWAGFWSRDELGVLAELAVAPRPCRRI